MTDQGPRPPPLPQKEPFPPAPSVATAVQVSALGQIVVKKIDDHTKNVEGRLKLFHEELALVRQQQVSTADTMPSPAPVSLPKQLAGHTVSLAKWGTLAIGVLGIAAQVAKVWRPGLAAPLDQAIGLAKQFVPGVQ